MVSKNRSSLIDTIPINYGNHGHTLVSLFHMVLRDLQSVSVCVGMCICIVTSHIY